MKKNFFNSPNNFVLNSSLNKEHLDLNDYLEKRRAELLTQSMHSTGGIAWPPPIQETPPWIPVRHVQANPKTKIWRTASKKVIALTTKTRRPEAWRALSEVSVAGISAALDQRSPPLRRILWGVVLVICSALMFMQCFDRIVRYLDEPVNVNVRITHNASLEYPAITVCNKNVFNFTAALELMVKYKLLSEDATDSQVNISLLIGKGGMTPTVLWELLAQQLDIFVAECWFGRGVRCKEKGQWTLVQTVAGPCYTYMINETHVSAVGSFHNLYLRLHETTPVHNKDETGVRILVHERRESPILTSRTNSMSAELGWSREVKLELRKFHILNTDQTPCRDDEEYSEVACQLVCFQKFMQEVTQCRMPYMDAVLMSNLSECANPGEYGQAVHAVSTMLLSGGWSTSNCTCPHECHQTAYQLYPENMAFKKNEIKLRIFYDNLVFEQITEELAYPMISLLCDIGGTLGLLMGASVLTVCELLEVVWSRFLQRCCRLKERQPPAINTSRTGPAVLPIKT